jgi:transcriptional regulator with XRE-family HTH domain
MAMTAYWAENIKRRLAALDLSQHHLAVFAGIHQAKISKSLSGLEPLTNEIIEKLDGTLKELEHLVEIFPCPLDLRRIDRVNELLNKVRLGDLGTVLILPEGKPLAQLSKELEEMNSRASVAPLIQSHE